MNNSNQIIEHLEKLGLSHDEAQMFLELFKRSPQIPRTLGEHTGVPRGRINEILKSLNKKGLIIEKPSRDSSPNQYETTLFPEGLERLKSKIIEKLLREKEIVNESYTELITLMTVLDRTSGESVEAIEKEEVVVIKGEKALTNHIKNVLGSAKNSVLTNFTAKLLLKYKSSFLKLNKRQITQTFVLADTELAAVKEVIKGAEAYVLNINSLEDHFLSVLSELRPSMVIVDNETAVILFSEDPPNGILVRNPDMLKYQGFILSIFMQGAEHIRIE